MNVLITGAFTILGRAIAKRLRQAHTVRLMDTVRGETDLEFVQGGVREEIVHRAVEGMEAIVQVPKLSCEGEQDAMDLATRGTYNLLSAGRSAGVRRTVYASTLRLFERYPEDWIVSEMWKPRPTPEVEVMAAYLGEVVCREFTRRSDFTAISLRVGTVVLEEEVRDRPFDPTWVDARDAASAFALALAVTPSVRRRESRWGVYHIGSAHPEARYPIDLARRELGYSPTRNFRGWPLQSEMKSGRE